MSQRGEDERYFSHARYRLKRDSDVFTSSSKKSRYGIFSQNSERIRFGRKLANRSFGTILSIERGKFTPSDRRRATVTSLNYKNSEGFPTLSKYDHDGEILSHSDTSF